MNNFQQATENNIPEVCKQIGQRASNIFLTRQLWCSGSVLVVLNRALGGDLTQDLAIRMTAGMGKGFGGGGCTCGGLSGAVLALGVFLGNGRLSASGDPDVLKASRELHDQFKKTFGSTCCRVLMKRNPPESKVQYEACSIQTAKAAELAATLILKHRPELLQRVDWNYLFKNESQLRGRLNIAVNRLRSD